MTFDQTIPALPDAAEGGSPKPTSTPFPRRQFCMVSGLTLLAVACGGGGPAGQGSTATGPVTTGNTLASLKVGEVVDYVSQGEFYLLRDSLGAFAVSSRCPHEGVDVVTGGPGFVCPRHGAEFTLVGVVQKGPALSDLVHLQVTESTPGGNLVVNPLRTVPAGQRLSAGGTNTQVTTTETLVSMQAGGPRDYIALGQFFLVNDAQGVYAISSVCTHLQCDVILGGAFFHCPCHGAEFDANGSVTLGPAVTPLIHFSVTEASPGGVLVVDIGTVVAAGTRLSAGSTPPSFSLSLTANALSLAVSSSGTDTVNLVRGGGFTGAVTLALTGLPSGVTAAFAPNSTTAASSILTLTASGAVTAGSYSLTVSGVSGSLTSSAILNLTVVAAGGGIVTTNTLASLFVGDALNYVAAGKFFLCCDASGVFAISSVCTHAGCDIATTGVTLPASKFHCPCHAAEFSATGVVTQNPTSGPLTIPLDHYLVTEPSPGAPLVVFPSTIVAAGTRLPGGNPAPTFTLSPASASLSIAQGASGTDLVTIARTSGFTGAVAMSVSALPTGVTGSMTPASASGASSTLSLTVAASAATGAATVTITGVNGTTSRTTTLTLNITSVSVPGFVTSDTRTSVTVGSTKFYRPTNTADYAKNFFLCHDAGGIFAVTSHCTHQGCDLVTAGVVLAASTFHCPCHAAEFAYDGTTTANTNGNQPPTLAALQHFKVTEPSPGAVLIVDTNTVVAAATRI